MFNITGTLKTKFPETQVSEKFRKREFVLTDSSSQYPQHISFQLVQDKCGIIDPFQPGDEIRVYFNLRGREWTSPQGEVKYFNTIDCWKIELVGASQGSAPAPQSAPRQASAPAPSAPPSVSEDFMRSDNEDDLPF